MRKKLSWKVLFKGKGTIIIEVFLEYVDYKHDITIPTYTILYVVGAKYLHFHFLHVFTSAY